MKKLEDWLQEESEKEWQKMGLGQMVDSVAKDDDEPTCDEITERSIYCEDYLSLQRTAPNLVFVYGTLKKGFWNHTILEDSPFLGVAKSCEPSWDITLSSPSGGFPIAWRKPVSHLTSRLMGEVYGCDARVMANLDRLEGEGHMYKREKHWFNLLDQKVQYPDGKVAHPVVNCWIYVGVQKFWKNVDMNENIPQKKITKSDGTEQWVIEYEKRHARLAA